MHRGCSRICYRGEWRAHRRVLYPVRIMLKYTIYMNDNSNVTVSGTNVIVADGVLTVTRLAGNFVQVVFATPVVNVIRVESDAA